MTLLTKLYCIFLIIFCIHGKKCSKKATIATFNTGLTPRLSEYEVRRKMIPAVVASLNADVICLQELWFEDDIKSVTEAAANEKFDSYSSLNSAVNPISTKTSSLWTRTLQAISDTPCLTWRLLPFLTCQFWYCRSKGKMELLQCMMKNCLSYVNAMPQECLSCIVIGYADPSTGVGRCVPLFHKYRRFNNQGLLLLSKMKIISARKQTFIDEKVKEILPRGYIEAKIDGIGTVICTHLTTNFSSTKYEYNLKYSSPKEQHADEISHLCETFKYRHGKHIIMGDLNTGPLSEKRDLWGDFPNNYKMFHRCGYTSSYEENNGTCTYCTYNSIQNNTTRGKLLDHILLTGQSYKNPKKIFTRRRKGKNLSDHFGIQVDVCFD
ncbi:uncharacterized protein LOC126827985 [Patella vulgata]|uniref:uncharacterized protein LOC126827985 n=1 Tax=Patella vulgata TaxID=6465 RepID=UPI0024A8607E|nr:uncharacterized protein LOC126827985 [Patella vulgata]